MKILNLEGLTYYTTNLLNKIKTMLDEKADKNHVHDKSEQMYSYTIDLSDNTYNQDTYYPVVGHPLPTNGFVRIKLAVQLNSGAVPTWSTHGGGFTCNLDLLTTSIGWGRTNGNTIILDSSYLWADSNPCGYSQMHNSSRPVLWLRGGGKYFVWSEYEGNFDIKTSEYTEYENTVAPTSTYPGIVLNKATIIANVQGNADTLDGYHSNDFQNNLRIHNKIDLKSGTFYDCILSKINEGFRGGKIEINNYCPSDTCNGNYWGFLEWTCNENKFAHLIFYSDRWEVMYVREISFNEETDTGWQRIGEGCNAKTIDGYGVGNSTGNYLRPINYGTSSLTPGSSSLTTGHIYLQYE